MIPPHYFSCNLFSDPCGQFPKISAGRVLENLQFELRNNGKDMVKYICLYRFIVGPDRVFCEDVDFDR